MDGLGIIGFIILCYEIYKESKLKQITRPKRQNYYPKKKEPMIIQNGELYLKDCLEQPLNVERFIREGRYDLKDNE